MASRVIAMGAGVARPTATSYAAVSSHRAFTLDDNHPIISGTIIISVISVYEKCTYMLMKGRGGGHLVGAGVVVTCWGQGWWSPVGSRGGGHLLGAGMSLWRVTCVELAQPASEPWTAMAEVVSIRGWPCTGRVILALQLTRSTSTGTRVAAVICITGVYNLCISPIIV